MASALQIRVNVESQQAIREIQNLRGGLVSINKTLAEQRQALLGATAEEQKKIRADIAANVAAKALIQSQIAGLNLQKQAITQTQREAAARERAAEQQVRAIERTRESQRLAVAELTAGTRMVFRQLADLTAGFVQSAGNMETFRNSIQAVTRDAAETDKILGQLLDLTVELVGIDTGDLISYAGRLMATGLSAEQAITAIRGVTERVAEQGKGAAVTSRVLEQLTQAINANHISAQDFRPILREMPTLWRDASNALGVQIQSLDDLRDAADAVGGPVEAIIRLTEEMGKASRGADLSSYNAQIDVLIDQSRILAAELGEHLLPTIVEILKVVNAWIEEFRELDDTAQAAIAWAAALATGITGIVTAVGTGVVALGALNASLGTLVGTGGLSGVGKLASGAATGIRSIVGPTNLATTTLITLTSAWRQIYSDFQKTPPFEDAVESLGALDISLSKTAQSLGITNDAFQNVEIQTLTGRMDELRGEIVRLTNAEGDNRAALTAARQEYRQLSAELQTQVAGYEALTPKVGDITTITRGLIDTQERLSVEIDTTDLALTALTPTLEQIALAYQASAKEARNFADTLPEPIDPLRDYAAALGLTSQVADTAFGNINEVGEAVRDADFRAAEAELRDFDDAFSLSTVTIPRATSEMEAFTGVVKQTEEQIQTTTQNVDDLLDSIEALGNGETALTSIQTSFEGLADDVVPRVTSDIVDTFVGIAEGDDISSAFNDLGSNIGDELMDGLSGVLSGQLSDAILGELSGPGLVGVGIGAQILSTVISGLTKDFRGGPLGLPDDFFAPAADLSGFERIANQPSLDDAKYQDFVDIVLGRKGGYEDPIQFLLDNAPGLIEQYKPRIDVDPRLGSADIYNSLFPEPSAREDFLPSVDVSPYTEEELKTAEEFSKRLLEIDKQLRSELLDNGKRFARQIRDIETDLSRDLEDIDTDLLREKRDILKELGREITDIHTDLGRRIRDINIDLNRDLLNIDRDLVRDKRDINIELGRDLRDINTELGREKRDIFKNLLRDIRDINLQLSRELIEIDKELARDLEEIDKELAREKRDIAKDLGRDLRDINTELARDFAEIERELARDIRDINKDLAREITDIDKDLGRERRDIKIALNRELEEIDKELARNLRDIDKDLKRDRRDINTEFNRDIRDIDKDFARDKRDAAEELSRDLEDIEKERLEKLEDLQEDHNKQTLRLAEKLKDDLEDLASDRVDTAEDIETEFERDLEDVLRDAGVSEKLFTHGDFTSIVRLAQAGTDDNLEQIRALAGLYGADLDTSDLENIRDAAITRQRDQQDLTRDYGSLIPGSAGFSFYRRQFERGELTDHNLIEQLFGRRGLADFLDFTRDTETLADRTAEQEADIEKETSLDIQGAQTDEDRAIEDARQSARDDKEDARQSARDDKEDARQSLRDDKEDAREDARQDKVDAREDARQDKIDARQDARDAKSDAREGADRDRTDAGVSAEDAKEEARIDAREDRIDARQSARDDKEDARQSARDDKEDAREDARQDKIDARQSARDDIADAKLSAEDDREDAQRGAQDDKEDAQRDARDDIADAEQSAIDAKEEARIDAREDKADARQDARDDSEDARQAAREDEADARQSARDDKEDARQAARHNKEDARQGLRDNNADALQSAEEDRVDLRAAAREQGILEFVNQILGEQGKLTLSTEELPEQQQTDALALQTALEPLLTQTTPTAILESQTAETAATTAETESQTATDMQGIVAAQGTNLERETATLELFSETVGELGEAVANIDEHGLALNIEVIELDSAELVRIHADSVVLDAQSVEFHGSLNLPNFTGGGGSTGEPGAVPQHPPTVNVLLDTKETARALDQNLVELDQSGQTFGSYQR